MIDNAFFSPSTIEYKTFNWISAISALIVVISVIILKKFRPSSVDRFTFNLQAAVALVDIPRHIVLVYSASNDETICTFLAFLTFFCTHLSLLFNVVIAANLQRIYIQNIVPSLLWRKTLYIFPVLFSLVLDLTPIVLGAYGLSRENACYLNDKYKHANLLRILLIYVTRIPGYLYCLIVFIIVIKKIYSESNTIEENGNLEAPLLRSNQSLEHSRLALRISFYPLTCFICHSGVIATQFYYYFTSDASYILKTWSFVGISTTGMFNLVSFLLDPALKEVFRRDSEDEETARPSSPYTQRQRNFRNRHRPPTPPRPPMPEQPPVEYGPHLESDHARYVRKSTEREEKIQFGPSYRVW